MQSCVQKKHKQHISLGVLKYIYDHYRQSGQVNRSRGSGRKQVTGKGEDRLIKRILLSDRKQTAHTIRWRFEEQPVNPSLLTQYRDAYQNVDLDPPNVPKNLRLARRIWRTGRHGTNSTKTGQSHTGTALCSWISHAFNWSQTNNNGATGEGESVCYLIVSKQPENTMVGWESQAGAASPPGVWEYLKDWTEM